MKSSGLGRRHGREGLLKYTETQNITSQHLVGIAPMAGMTDQGFARSLTGALRIMKALRMP
jgi:succinate-semialdehyde dehydrogenase/glutarate-semialdehyde dehydrogenase